MKPFLGFQGIVCKAIGHSLSLEWFVEIATRSMGPIPKPGLHISL